MKINSLICFGFLLLLACDKTVDIPIFNEKSQVFYHSDEFIMGADLSYVNAIEDNGGVYKMENQAKDPYQIFKENGTNLIRVRLWHSPENWQQSLNNGKIYGDFEDVSKTIKRAKETGLKVLLDLHYSDTWADPQKQFKPKVWENLSINLLKDSVFSYTKNTLSKLAAQNLTPEYIQLGNECNQGMLFPEGKILNDNFKPFADILKTAISAVKSFQGTQPKIIIHVAQFQNADWWLNGLINQQNLSGFDIIGLSHYFPYSTINSMNAIEAETAKLINKYQKDLWILETAYPWTSDNADNYNNIFSGQVGATGYGVSQNSQQQFMTDLTHALFKGGGKGIIYWEPAWISSSLKDSWGTGSSWENNAFFDFDGNLTSTIKYMTQNYQIQN